MDVNNVNDLNLLSGTKLRLAALEERDAQTIAQWSGDAGYLRLLDTGMARPKTARQVAAELDQLDTASDTLLLAIRRREDDQLVGTVGFHEIEWSNQVAWLTIGIGERANWGRGYGGEALRLALRYAFDEMNLHRLTLTVIAYNERAITLYEQAGFQREGIFREFGQRDGKRYDMYLYGLLRSEWQSAAPQPEKST
jgi:RimJ/RimL family protein N-acetyltransferase